MTWVASVVGLLCAIGMIAQRPREEPRSLKNDPRLWTAVNGVSRQYTGRIASGDTEVTVNRGRAKCVIGGPFSMIEIRLRRTGVSWKVDEVRELRSTFPKERQGPVDAPRGWGIGSGNA